MRIFKHPSASRMVMRLALEVAGKSYGLAASSNTSRITIRFTDGCSKGFIQTGILTPVELVEIRLQLSSSTTQSTTGPLAMARSIVRTEGLQGLYRGLGITILRDAPSHPIYFSSYEYMHERLHPGCRKSQQESPLTMLTARGIGGIVSWVSSYPLDVVVKIFGLFYSFVFCNWFWFRFGRLVQDFWLETAELCRLVSGDSDLCNWLVSGLVTGQFCTGSASLC
ncbi:hypothetical protein L7F22_011596 [Adiantum nelumboides]|nr:hypothetical protein [Adiantum nelumboides]